MRKKGVYANFGFPIKMKQRAALIKEMSFDTVSIWWEDFLEYDDPLSRQVEFLRANGLFLENVHVSYMGVNDLWLDNLNGQVQLEKHFSYVDDCKRFSIPAMVMHTNVGYENIPPVTPIGLERMNRLAAYAQAQEVHVVCENSYVNAHLEAVLDGIASPYLNFCFDSSHDYLFSEVPFALIEKYQDRLTSLHLSDTDGKEDLHRMPGDGVIDWDKLVHKLLQAGYNGSCFFEVMARPEDKTPEEFLKELKRRADRMEKAGEERMIEK